MQHWDLSKKRKKKTTTVEYSTRARSWYQWMWSIRVGHDTGAFGGWCGMILWEYGWNMLERSAVSCSTWQIVTSLFKYIHGPSVDEPGPREGRTTRWFSENNRWWRFIQKDVLVFVTKRIKNGRMINYFWLMTNWILNELLMVALAELDSVSELIIEMESKRKRKRIRNDVISYLYLLVRLSFSPVRRARSKKHLTVWASRCSGGHVMMLLVLKITGRQHRPALLCCRARTAMVYNTTMTYLHLGAT